ncbi:hypothetical protein AVEN_229096-1 [Araneus ventricosus]|uniref:Reverse transcriptase domain-containing protein n=1 Tax=Araneus ventricosus TaxID=182803 RepID=A0A4Y2M7B4_ARAVE|nr:hypothetical protein AVEN_229096-1 [Araneus ventricosus]
MKKSSMKQPETFNLKSTKLASKFIKLKKRNPLIPNVTWWNRDLQIKKQILKAVARRLQKCRGEDRIHYKIILSKKKLFSRKQSKEPNVDLGDCYATRHIVKKIPNCEATGYDGIYIIVKVIINSFPSLLLDIFNKCLELKCFPDPLKIGPVILFHKTGKEEQNIKSYRPISLLPTIGKLLQKLLLQRFNFQLQTKNSNVHCSTDLEKEVS